MPFSTIQTVSSKTYTYIIVGGGTAGCVLAARLSEDPKVSVLLVERGPVVDGWSAGVPLLSSNFSDQKAPVYKWQSAPLSAANGKTLTMVTGKALGGSSKINGLLYTRSVPGEYNAWGASGRKEWDWNHVEPFFIKSETSLSNPKADYCGKAGPWQTRSVDKIHFKPVSRNVDIAPSLGITHVREANNPASPVASCTLLEATIDSHGKRSATPDAFLSKKLIQSRRNLDICTEILVPCLEIHRQKVLGVYLEFDRANHSTPPQRFHVKADREVILCAGAIATPQILLLSGIGPTDHLRHHNISVVKDLPGVGSHLQDHLSVPIIYKVPVGDSIAVLMGKPLTAVRELIRYVFTGKGIFGTQVQQANIVLPSALLDDNSQVQAQELDPRDPSNIPDIEIMLIPINPTDRTFDISASTGTFSYLCTVLRPKSSGTVRLISQNPREQPLCDLGNLSHPDDRVPMRKVLRLALALGQKVSDSGYPLENLLVPVGETDQDLDRFVEENLTTTYHYSSTCRMDKENHMGVVDDEMRVHGIEGLRIADASVFPQIPACHLQAPVVMLAERCAAFLRRE
ncbi:GMC oxidoreductase [Mycena floridula]|nr:GMC oxidoreductase [Mycena floridula]